MFGRDLENWCPRSGQIWRDRQGHSGIHFEVMNAVQRYGKAQISREEAISMLKQLLTEYEEKHLGSQRQSDEQYLSQFDEALE